LGSFGSDDEHLSFSVPACTRPIMAGDKISPAPAVVDDLKNTRRLTRPVIMTLPPQDFFCCAAVDRCGCTI
jgi:hypothetical protein